MKAYKPFLALFLFAGTSCHEDKTEIAVCESRLISGNHNFHSLILSLPDDVISGLTKNPDPDGALGRNVGGYFHVRFQLDTWLLASYAVYFKNDEALEKFILSAEYSFIRQKASGDFDLVIPSELQSLGPPTPADVLSGTAFYLSALGSSLILLNQSEWFLNRPQDALTQRLSVLSNKFQLSLDYLKSQKEILKSYDAKAANRLLFDALAFYSMGMYLNDGEAKSIGIEFIELALTKQNSAGYFVEADGYDSSYNGVTIRLGMILLGILSSQEPVYERLKKSLGCSVQWQASRVLDTGEISLQGNTRVFPGGEKFLGTEKQIAWTESLLAFYFTYALSSEAQYLTLAKNLESFYR